MNAAQSIASASVPPPAAPAAAPAAAPVVAAAGMPPAPPPMPPMNPSYAEGGEMGSKKNLIKDFFSDINLVEAGIMALGVATFLYAIYYYKFEMQLSKTGYADLNGRMLSLEADMKKAKQKAEAGANANGQGGMRLRKRVMF